MVACGQPADCCCDVTAQAQRAWVKRHYHVGSFCVAFLAVQAEGGPFIS